MHTTLIAEVFAPSGFDMIFLLVLITDRQRMARELVFNNNHLIRYGPKWSQILRLRLDDDISRPAALLLRVRLCQ